MIIFKQVYKKSRKGQRFAQEPGASHAGLDSIHVSLHANVPLQKGFDPMLRLFQQQRGMICRFAGVCTESSERF